jgi:hypothetical protein
VQSLVDRSLEGPFFLISLKCGPDFGGLDVFVASKTRDIRGWRIAAKISSFDLRVTQFEPLPIRSCMRAFNTHRNV